MSLSHKSVLDISRQLAVASSCLVKRDEEVASEVGDREYDILHFLNSLHLCSFHYQISLTYKYLNSHSSKLFSRYNPRAIHSLCRTSLSPSNWSLEVTPGKELKMCNLIICTCKSIVPRSLEVSSDLRQLTWSISDECGHKYLSRIDCDKNNSMCCEDSGRHVMVCHPHLLLSPVYSLMKYSGIKISQTT